MANSQTNSNFHGMNITVSEFDSIGTDEGCSPMTTVYKYTLSNGWMEVDIIDYGATITAIRVPDHQGNIADIVLGYDNIKGYMANNNNPYFGATIGRVTNRIAGGKFILDNVQYFLSKNEGEKTLHGGISGFNKRLWRGCITNEGLVFEMVSPHLDQGFPGELHVKATFALTKMNEFIITFVAQTDHPTPVNMTNHAYFNLAGHETGSKELYEHNLMINANYFTPIDDTMIPLGKLQDVLDTMLDFTTSKNLGEAIEKTGDSNGFDINFCLTGPTFGRKLMACVEHPSSGRRMVIHSNAPGVQLYTANCLQVKEGKGKGGAGYYNHSGLCLESQNYPNAMNQKNFPNCIIIPPQEYFHVISYHFSTFKPPPPPPPNESVITDEESRIDYDIKQDYTMEKESTTSQKEDENECTRSISQTDLPECQTGLVRFPDFTVGFRYHDHPLTYEPYSEFKPYHQCLLDDFQALLKQCQVLSTSVKPYHTIRPKPKYDSIFNIMTNTELTQSRHNQDMY